MPTFAEILAKAAPSETTVSLVLGGQYLEQIRQLEAQLLNAKAPESLAERNPATVIAEQIQALREEMAGTEVEFHLRAMPGRQWDRFKFLQPTRGKDEVDDSYMDRFFLWLCNLVSITCVEPAMTPEQVAELVDAMPGSSWDALSEAAWALNTGKVSVPFSAAAYALMSVSDEALRRPSDSASPTPAGSVKSQPKRRSTSTTASI